MQNQPVFYDPQGKRGTGVSRIVVGGLFVFSLLCSLFAISLIIASPLLPTPQKPKESGSIGSFPPTRKANSPASKARRILEAEIQLTRHSRIPKPLNREDHVVAAFYAPWQETAYPDFQTAVDNLTHVMPMWVRLGADGKSLDLLDYRDPTDFAKYQGNRSVWRIARNHGVRVCPILTNQSLAGFDPKRAHALLNDEATMKLVANQLDTWLRTENFQGINLDLENLQEGDYRRVPKFIAILKKALSQDGLELSIDVEDDLSRLPIKQILPHVDFVVLMNYDEHSEDASPGPIASFDWTEKKLDEIQKIIPADKLVGGIGSYAYDWNLSRPKASAESDTYAEALAAANGYRPDEKPEDVIKYDDESLNSTFNYKDEYGMSHEVWLLGAESVFNQWRSVQVRNIRGAAIWVLGEDDPTLWRFVDRRKFNQKPDPKLIESVTFPSTIDYAGKGEILTVQSEAKEGSRRVEVDNDGLIVASKFVNYPLPFEIRQSGFKDPKEIVLTFDDGPDPEWTPKVLDELRQLKVPATFFIIGKNAETNRNLVAREYAEGHEIGNHTFFHPNMGLVTEWRANLEIDATQRLIESITGCGSILFRPPYNADAQPKTPQEVRPVKLASKKEYLTVGEKVDPNDWDLVVRNPDGSTRSKTAQDIYESTMEQILRYERSGEEGNIVLLHDAGGNREQTVKALPMIVNSLRAKGFRFVTVASLLNKKRSDIMPPVTVQERWAIFVDTTFFNLVFGAEWLLAVCFTLAIALGLSRVLSMLPLALLHSKRLSRFSPDPTYRPFVSALIAAYNEESTIVRTIQSILSSNYPIAEVVVVNDGSKDNTAQVVEQHFGHNPNVRLINQENGGKSTALNRATIEASGEILFCVDADTQLDPKAVSLLVRHFVDPQIGAVAGNVRVGNVSNLVTLWQAIEYTTSQNVDRRAFAYLNAVTVVPGAIGAWRRDAVAKVGGYLTDTLAEDMDLTWRLRIAGYRVETESNAIAYTEAPDSFRAFYKQRFRWTYGTLQCLWKHRKATFHHGWFGGFALPGLWLFQILFQSIAPLVDLQVFATVSLYVIAFLTSRGQLVENSSMPEASHSMAQVGFLYGLFFGVELLAATIGYAMDKQKPSPLWWLFLQRFVYRQILYIVAWKSFIRAIKGQRQGWGKIDRRGSVNLPTEPEKSA